MTFDRKSKCVRLVAHKVFTPTPGDPIDFEATIEKTLREWQRALRHAAGAVRSVPDGERDAAADAGADAGRRISADVAEFDGDDLEPVRPDQRAAAGAVSGRCRCDWRSSHAIITESSRGWKLDKMKQQHKIDVDRRVVDGVLGGGEGRRQGAVRSDAVGLPMTRRDLHRQEQLAFNRYVATGGMR